MSTKNLARTVIEGGRCGHYKLDVSKCSASERSSERNYLREVMQDVETSDAIPAPVRKPVSPCFDDKISPVLKFLNSRVGKSWNKTRAMIAERFDIRTTPGRHIVRDHLLNDIALHGEHELSVSGWGRWYRYFVDKTGVLRLNQGFKTRFKSPARPKAETPHEKILSWLRNRKIGRLGNRFVWFVPTRHPEAVRVVMDDLKLVWADLDATGNVVREDILYPEGRRGWEPRSRAVETTSPFRATGLLTSEEESFFLSCAEHFQNKILQAAPHRDIQVTRR